MRRRIINNQFSNIAVKSITKELTARNWNIMGGQPAVRKLLSRPLNELSIHTIENILTVLNKSPSPSLKEEKKALSLELQKRIKKIRQDEREEIL